MRMSGGIFEAAIIVLLPPIVAIVDHFGQASFHGDHVQPRSGRMARQSFDGPEDLPKEAPCQGLPCKLDDETAPREDKGPKWNLELVKSGIQK